MSELPVIGPIVGATMTTADLDATAQRYRQALGWVEAPRSQLSAAMARRWGVPTLAGFEVATVAPARGGRAGIRMIGVPGLQPVAPLRTWGWAAVEVCVPDVDAAVARARVAGFRLLNAPVRLSGQTGSLPLVAAQVAGPDGEVLYLTQLLGDVPGFELPLSSDPDGEVFICVLATPDLPAARQVLESRFAVTRASDRHVAIRVLNTVFGLPQGTLHRISSLQLAGRHALEIDQYPDAARARQHPGADVAAGVFLVSVLGQMARPKLVRLPGAAMLEVLPANDASIVQRHEQAP